MTLSHLSSLHTENLKHDVALWTTLTKVMQEKCESEDFKSDFKPSWTRNVSKQNLSVVIRHVQRSYSMVQDMPV